MLFTFWRAAFYVVGWSIRFVRCGWCGALPLAVTPFVVQMWSSSKLWNDCFDIVTCGDRLSCNLVGTDDISNLLTGPQSLELMSVWPLLGITQRNLDALLSDAPVLPIISCSVDSLLPSDMCGEGKPTSYIGSVRFQGDSGVSYHANNL